MTRSTNAFLACSFDRRNKQKRQQPKTDIMFNLSKSQEIADLQAKVDALTTENATHLATIGEHTATLATVTAERDTALASVQSEKDKVAAAEHLLAETQAKITTLETESAAKIEAEVISRLASAGTDPIPRAKESAADSPESKTAPTAGLTGLAKARAALQARAAATALAQKN